MPLRRIANACLQTGTPCIFVWAFLTLCDWHGGRLVRLITSCAKPSLCPTGWSAHELALFARAAKFLSSGGLRIQTDYGLTDEGEAWLVFCNAESGDVCGHFAKMSEGYLACIPFREHGLRG